jgi:aminoglycoside phosphotransferase (APT) family kinase protein
MIKFEAIVRQVFPDSALLNVAALTGGVSAQVSALDVRHPAGDIQKVVVRQYGAANLRSDPHVATHEYQLLEMLAAAAVPVPHPIYADESGTILPTPYLVLEFIDGHVVEQPPDLTSFVQQLADALVRIHLSGILQRAAFLRNTEEGFSTRIRKQPENPDEPLSESGIRAGLAKAWPLPRRNQPTVVHGDFWPGNTLWKRDKLVSVIDWEDAGIGDPLIDLANGRCELSMAFDLEAAHTFTERYRSLRPELDYTDLPVWDLCAALGPVGKMAAWGLDDTTFAKLQSGHKAFVDHVLEELSD